MDKVSGKKNGSFVDTLVAIFKNVWLKRGVALACWGYTILLIWIDWLNLAYFVEYDNPTSLFVLYVFVNCAALGLMIYTRRQVITQINVMILPPILFVSFILAFGNWYMILPPLCVIVAMFFICRANETLKTVLGTMYLLMYVVGAAAYITITLLMGKITLTGVDLQLRDRVYEEISPDGNYRIVRYIDKPSVERRTASYYVEDTTEDIKIPFGSGKKVLGSGWVLTTKYTSADNRPVSWVKTTIDGESVQALNVEGSIRENPYLVEEAVVNEETEEPESGGSALSDPESGEPASTAETAETAQTARTDDTDETAVQ